MTIIDRSMGASIDCPTHLVSWLFSRMYADKRPLCPSIRILITTMIDYVTEAHYFVSMYLLLVITIIIVFQTEPSLIQNITK